MRERERVGQGERARERARQGKERVLCQMGKKPRYWGSGSACACSGFQALVVRAGPIEVPESASLFLSCCLLLSFSLFSYFFYMLLLPVVGRRTVAVGLALIVLVGLGLAGHASTRDAVLVQVDPAAADQLVHQDDAQPAHSARVLQGSRLYDKDGRQVWNAPGSVLALLVLAAAAAAWLTRRARPPRPPARRRALPDRREPRWRSCLLPSCPLAQRLHALTLSLSLFPGLTNQVRTSPRHVSVASVHADALLRRVPSHPRSSLPSTVRPVGCPPSCPAAPADTARVGIGAGIHIAITTGRVPILPAFTPHPGHRP